MFKNKFLLFSLMGLGSFSLFANPIAKSFGDKTLQWGPCPDVFPKGCEVSVLQGDPSKGSSDVYIRIPGNYSFPPHTHTSAEHIVLVQGEMKVRYQSNEEVTLKPGNYAYGPSKHPHEAKCTGKKLCVIYVGFDSPIDAMLFTGKL